MDLFTLDDTPFRRTNELHYLVAFGGSGNVCFDIFQGIGRVHAFHVDAAVHLLYQSDGLFAEIAAAGGERCFRRG